MRTFGWDPREEELKVKSMNVWLNKSFIEFVGNGECYRSGWRW